MNFESFKNAVIRQFNIMTANRPNLFVVQVERNELWDVYLESFPEGTNEIYKERREFDCNCCKSFIRNYGKIVTVKNNQLVSIWDDLELEYPFDIVARSLSAKVHSAAIDNFFLTDVRKLGVGKNLQRLEDGKVITWHHFQLDLPKQYQLVNRSDFGTKRGEYQSSKDVFKRSMEELTLEAGETLLELILQNSIYRGAEFKKAIQAFIKYKKQFEVLPEEQKDNWCWENSINNPVSRIRNTAIGTILVDISNGEELDQAVRKFEAVMAPANYKRPKPIFTKKMVELAEKKIQELGLANSLARKYARLLDITVNNVLFVNRDAEKKISGSVFDTLKKEAVASPKKFGKPQEVDIEKFIKDILPTAHSIEALVENKHCQNFVSLIGPEETSAPSILKWNNNFSWAYQGDLTDSMRERVKKAGGKVDGDLRFSIQWNESGKNENDYDAHCVEPNGNHIFFNNLLNRETRGNLDVDIINPNGKVAVENITWPDKRKMLEGKYQFFVHNYTHRGGQDGFAAEIEFDGQIYSFEYRKLIRHNERVTVAEVEYTRENGFRFLSSMNSKMSSKKIWGLDTNKFHEVSVCMLSPNYWDGQKGIGNKHYFFFLTGCKNEETPCGFFNEFLNQELTPHRKVFEALSSKMRVEDSDEQLSGLGFSSTQRNEIVLRVKGKTSRVVRVKF